MDQRRRALVRSDRALRRVKLAAREAARAVKELEHFADVDVFGRFTYRGETDDGELLEFLRLAHSENNGQELELILVAQIGQGGAPWQDNGSTQQSRPES